MRASKATYPTNALQNSTWQSGVWLNGATMFVDSAPRVIALQKKERKSMFVLVVPLQQGLLLTITPWGLERLLGCRMRKRQNTNK